MAVQVQFPQGVALSPGPAVNPADLAREPGRVVFAELPTADGPTVVWPCRVLGPAGPEGDGPVQVTLQPFRPFEVGAFDVKPAAFGRVYATAAGADGQTPEGEPRVFAAVPTSAAVSPDAAGGPDVTTL